MIPMYTEKDCEVATGEGDGAVHLRLTQVDGTQARVMLTPVEARGVAIRLRRLAANQDTNRGDKTRPRRVVCAALRNPKGDLVLGARHFDSQMHKTLDAMTPEQRADWTKGQIEQGFIDQWDVFMTREEAWAVAMAGGQVIRRAGNDEDHLYSENLY